MINDSVVNELTALYAKQSKHSNYQVLPTLLSNILQSAALQTVSRSEQERWKWIKKYVEFQDKTVVDIGANTGFFILESIAAGARNAEAVEGNTEHSHFIQRVGELLEIPQLKVSNRYVDFMDVKDIPSSDILILLNVLHHLGDDFGDQSINMQEAKRKMALALRNAFVSTRVLIFQLGFNWKGNRALGLFENGIKKEIVEFVTNSLKGEEYEIIVGVAERSNGIVDYKELNEWNAQRVDEYGEFLNRPIFIIKRRIEND